MIPKLTQETGAILRVQKISRLRVWTIICLLLLCASTLCRADTWKLVWHDEFNRDGPPDAANWDFERGFVRNEEAQWYQPENAVCRKGMLIIEARREHKPNPDYQPGGRGWKNREFVEYTSACLVTKHKREFTYGRIEMRARIDTRAGSWPAFWTLGASVDTIGWPRCGEVDIMEYYRGMMLANVLHTRGGRQNWTSPRRTIEALGGEAWANRFHVWTMEWDEAKVDLLLDGKLCAHLNVADDDEPGKPNAFRSPHFLLLNQAVGGQNGGDPSHTDFPVRLEVDWVRVYQRQDKVKEAVQTPVFIAGTDGYASFRIPSLLVTKQGTLLAFCEGRRQGAADSGAIALVMRRSVDGGKTWDPLKVVWADGANTCGNPCPVVDQKSGTIHMLMTHNDGADREAQIMAGTSRAPRTVWVTKSVDDGLTWSPPRDITTATKRPDWTWYATGPGVGIQMQKGPHIGRLIVPCDHALAGTKEYGSHVIYSDDRGESWKLGGSCPQLHTNECQAAELSDGRLMLNMRSADKSHKERGVCYSADGGATWTGFRYDATLIEPICQASMIACRLGRRSGLLFSNPADAAARKNLTVRLSRDDGATWPAARTLHAGSAAYSCLAALSDGAIACLYECGGVNPYETITFARFGPDWLGH